MKTCNVCGYSTKNSSNFKRHVQAKHRLSNYSKNSNNKAAPVNDETFDIRLKENFKLFVSGPSRCGKTVFVSKLIENIQSFAKQPPTLIIYVYKVWQDKYEEMQSLGVNFIENNEKAVKKIKSVARGQAI